MYNRTQYDRTLYDRSSGDNGVEAYLRGTSKLDTKLLFKIFFPQFTMPGKGNVTATLIMRLELRIGLEGSGDTEVTDFRLLMTMGAAFSGKGYMNPGLVLRVPVSSKLSGSGQMLIEPLIKIFFPQFDLIGKGSLSASSILRLALTVPFAGSGTLNVSDFRLLMALNPAFAGKGDLIPKIAMRVPFSATMGGTGKMALDDRVKMLQHMSGKLSGSGTLNRTNMIMRQIIEPILSGSGNVTINNKLKLLLAMTFAMNGAGNVLLRLGDLNTDVLEFDGLNLLPGQTLIVDTDDENVLINGIEDVDSVTVDSTFFQLQPGDNEIAFSTDSNQKLGLTIIWQNRWL